MTLNKMYLQFRMCVSSPHVIHAGKMCMFMCVFHSFISETLQLDLYLASRKSCAYRAWPPPPIIWITLSNHTRQPDCHHQLSRCMRDACLARYEICPSFHFNKRKQAPNCYSNDLQESFLFNKSDSFHAIPLHCTKHTVDIFCSSNCNQSSWCTAKKSQ